MKYYDSIENLPLWNFDKYRTNRDLRFFIFGHEGRQSQEPITEELKNIEAVIIDEYFSAINDNSMSRRMQKFAEIESLKLKYNVCLALVNRLWIGFSDSQMETRLLLIKELASHGYKIPEINTLGGDFESLTRAKTAIEGLKTRVKLIEIELKKDDKKESSNLTKQLQIATIQLQYPYRLNSKEITVLEWIEICKLLEEK